MRVFLDTNVWLSAIVFPGLCSELLTEFMESEHELLTSALIHAEMSEVMQRKFSQHNLAITLFEHLWKEATCVTDIDDPADDADARLVIAAATAGAELFVTGDLRVLAWNTHRSMQIISPRDTWKLLFMASH